MVGCRRIFCRIPLTPLVFLALQARGRSAGRSVAIEHHSISMQNPYGLREGALGREGYGDGYAYDHDAPDAFSGQNYFPDRVKREYYYQPVERGFERDLKKRLDFFAKLREKRSGG